jgi:hypothetical protein
MFDERIARANTYTRIKQGVVTHADGRQLLEEQEIPQSMILFGSTVRSLNRTREPSVCKQRIWFKQSKEIYGTYQIQKSDRRAQLQAQILTVNVRVSGAGLSVVFLGFFIFASERFQKSAVHADFSSQFFIIFNCLNYFD